MKNKLAPGIYGIYKPKGPTSRRLLNDLQKITGIKKIGHAGTLDPLASGVLVVAIGKDYTKKISENMAKEKEYLATVKLGQTSNTDDEEGEKTVVNLDVIPTKEDVEVAIKYFIGEIEQMPPVYSAIKIRGQEAYKYARRGEEISLQARKILIKDISLIEYNYPLIKIKVVCGPGVYIRSLARDLGAKLGTGAYMSDLIRTRVGEWTLENAVHLD